MFRLEGGEGWKVTAIIGQKSYCTLEMSNINTTPTLNQFLFVGEKLENLEKMASKISFLWLYCFFIIKAMFYSTLSSYCFIFNFIRFFKISNMSIINVAFFSKKQLTLFCVKAITVLNTLPGQKGLHPHHSFLKEDSSSPSSQFL